MCGRGDGTGVGSTQPTIMHCSYFPINVFVLLISDGTSCGLQCRSQDKQLV